MKDNFRLNLTLYFLSKFSLIFNKIGLDSIKTAKQGLLRHLATILPGSLVIIPHFVKTHQIASAKVIISSPVAALVENFLHCKSLSKNLTPYT